MGYCISLRESEFWISRLQFRRAAKTLEWESEKALELALLESGWAISRDPLGNVTEIDFTGEKPNGEIQDVLLGLSPFVRAGSFIKMEGEDGAPARWLFDGKRCRCKGFAVDDVYGDYLRQLGISATDEEAEDEEEDQAEEDEADDD